MAGHTVLEVADALLPVFREHLRFRMLMASVAGETRVVIALMAGHARGSMILVEHKVSGVIEGGRFPGRALVASRAFHPDIAVHGILRRDEA